MAMVRPAFSGPSQIGIKYYGLVTLPWREVVLTAWQSNWATVILFRFRKVRKT